MKSIFTIPADFKIESLKKILELNKEIDIKATEVYGSLPNSTYGSGRKINVIPKIEYDEFKDYINFCNENGITFNYTFNFTCINNDEFKENGKVKIIQEIKKLKRLGIKSFTISNPAIIEIIDSEFPDLDITVSVITGVDSMQKLKYFCKYNSVKVIYLHEKVYRQLKLLKNMIQLANKFRKKIGIIVNSTCLSECPFRQYHYNFCSHAKEADEYMLSEYYCTKCKIEKLKDKRKILTMPWIRPEDLKKYVDLNVYKFKISGRELAGKSMNIVRMVKEYNNYKYNGNLMELFKGFTKCYYAKMYFIKNDKHISNYLKDIFEEKLNCYKYGCTDCMKCKEALKSIDINSQEKEKALEKAEKEIMKFKFHDMKGGEQL